MRRVTDGPGDIYERRTAREERDSFESMQATHEQGNDCGAGDCDPCFRRFRVSNEMDIWEWFCQNYEEHLDKKTDEINLTSMVEAWDSEVATGDLTEDEDHVAWEVAADFQKAVKDDSVCEHCSVAYISLDMHAACDDCGSLICRDCNSNDDRGECPT